MYILKRFLLGLFMLLVLGAGTLPAAAATDETAFLREVYEKAYSLQSEAFTFQGQAGSPLGNFVVKASGRNIMKPSLLMQADVELEMYSLLGSKFHLQTPCYMEETAKAFVVYYQRNGQWEKQTMKKAAGAEDLSKPLSADASMALVRSAQLVRETAQQKVLKVVFDGKKLADIGRRAMAAEPDKKQSLLARQQMDKLLDAIGDIECTMTVDKATGYAVQSEADLTPMARRLAHSIVTDMPKLKAAEKQQLMAMVDHATVHVATTASEFNAVKEIVIPAEVRAAKEAPKPQKKDTKKAAAV